MSQKNYKSIQEVSKLLNLNSHVIRYWDSKFTGISTRLSNKKQRFFNADNIKKIRDLKNAMYDNGKINYSLDLANKIISTKNNNLNQLDALKESTNLNYSNSTKIMIEKLKIIKNNLKKLIDI